MFLGTTKVGDYINTMKTTLDFNFYLYQAFEQHRYTKTQKQREDVNSKSNFISKKAFTESKLK